MCVCVVFCLSLGFSASPELALAFAATRPIRRVFLPVEIAVAAFAARAFPILTRFNVSGLFAAAKDLGTNKTGTSDSNGSSSEVPAGAPPDTAQSSSVWTRVGSMVDKYGVAYLLSARYTGIALVFGVEAVLSAGFDLKTWLASVGLGDVGECLFRVCRRCVHARLIEVSC